MHQLQQTRFINGLTFIQNGSEWMDALIQQQHPDVELVEIMFNSDTYYQLLRDHPEAAPWLSTGRNVQLVLNDKAYRVRDH